MLKPEVIDALRLTVSRLQGYARVENSLREIAVSYQASGTISKWDCFCSSPDDNFKVSEEEWRSVRLAAWSKFCRSEVQYHDIEGDHLSCVRPPLIEGLAGHINKVLTARGI